MAYANQAICRYISIAVQLLAVTVTEAVLKTLALTPKFGPSRAYTLPGGIDFVYRFLF
jgi:hypothetical protein